MTPVPIRLEKHAPERRPSSVTTFCGACCCCCCCLHTVGALLGSALAPALPMGSSGPADSDDEAVERRIGAIRSPGISAVALFWWIFLGLLGIGLLIGLLNRDIGSLTITLIILALILPGLQLVSALVVILFMACWPRPDRGYQLVQMGKVSAGVLVGSALGIGAMFLIGILFLH